MVSESVWRPIAGVCAGAALVVGLVSGVAGPAAAGNKISPGLTSSGPTSPGPVSASPAYEHKIDDALTSRAGIRRIQGALSDLGYPLGRADGKLGQRTRAAIAQYQAASGLVADGSVSDQLYRSLRIAPPPPAEAVRLVQAKLTDLGYGVGTIDGVAGPRTHRAIQTYQMIADMRADGEISFALIDHLYGVVTTPAPTLAARPLAAAAPQIAAPALPGGEPAVHGQVAALAPADMQATPITPLTLALTADPNAAMAIVPDSAPIAVATAAMVPPPVPSGVPSGLSGGLVTPGIKATVYDTRESGAEPALLEAAELRGLYCEPDPDVAARGGRCQVSWGNYLQDMRRFLDQTPR